MTSTDDPAHGPRGPAAGTTGGRDDGDLAELRHDARLLLRSVRQSVTTLLEMVEADGGAAPDLKALAARTAEFEKTARLVIEIELRLDDLFAKQERALAAHEIDFDAVRHDIGCRLDRIRECGPQDGLPGEPD